MPDLFLSSSPREAIRGGRWVACTSGTPIKDIDHIHDVPFYCSTNYNCILYSTDRNLHCISKFSSLSFHIYNITFTFTTTSPAYPAICTCPNTWCPECPSFWVASLARVRIPACRLWAPLLLVQPPGIRLGLDSAYLVSQALCSSGGVFSQVQRDTKTRGLCTKLLLFRKITWFHFRKVLSMIFKTFSKPPPASFAQHKESAHTDCLWILPWHLQNLAFHLPTILSQTKTRRK